MHKDVADADVDTDIDVDTDVAIDIERYTMDSEMRAGCASLRCSDCAFSSRCQDAPRGLVLGAAGEHRKHPGGRKVLLLRALPTELFTDTQRKTHPSAGCRDQYAPYVQLRPPFR